MSFWTFRHTFQLLGCVIYGLRLVTSWYQICGEECVQKTMRLILIILFRGCDMVFLMSTQGAVLRDPAVNIELNQIVAPNGVVLSASVSTMLCSRRAIGIKLAFSLKRIGKVNPLKMLIFGLQDNP